MANNSKPIEDMTPAERDAELQRLSIEHSRLQLEDLTMRVENEKARRGQIARAHKSAMDALADANMQIVASQNICRHKQGGKNMEGIANGTDSNYSVIKNTYPWGEISVLCSRCGKEWREPKPELEREDPKAFAKQLAEYHAALNLPTNNEPCGTQLFMIIRNPPPPVTKTKRTAQGRARRAS